MAVFQIVHLLADAVLPFSITDETLIKLSVPGVLMLVLQQAHDPSEFPLVRIHSPFWILVFYEVRYDPTADLTSTVYS